MEYCALSSGVYALATRIKPYIFLTSIYVASFFITDLINTLIVAKNISFFRKVIKHSL